MSTFRSAAVAVMTGLSLTLAFQAAVSRPVTFQDSWWAKNGADDDFGARAGWEPNIQAAPDGVVAAAQRLSAAQAFDSLAALESDSGEPWEALGPTVGNVPGPVTFTGAPSVVSGRTTSIVISSRCTPHSCIALVGTAGGGVWKTDNALAAKPQWRPSSTGLHTSAIGSLFYDPTDKSGSTVYAGTGEPNGSSDSEAGLGLYKSTDNGEHWTHIAGSFDVAHDRAIAAIAVDPANSRHLWIGTAVARHGATTVNGGRFTPPGAPQVGLYESIDGGRHFFLSFSQPSDAVDPKTPNGADFFRGGVSKILIYRTPDKKPVTQLYFSMFDYGLFRATSSKIEQVFASAGGGTVANSLSSRTEFALAPIGRFLRIYVGDVGNGPADFYRVDNANVPAATLTDGTQNPGWIKLSSSTKGTPGFSSFNFCQGQCTYDMFVATPPGQTDTVWLGGSMQYGELFGPSNGRGVVRSTDGGVTFTDMTNDTVQDPAPHGLHPDHHTLAFFPGLGDRVLEGSDGGVARTSGLYADASAECSDPTRNLSGADLTDCLAWLSNIPTQIESVSPELNTLQFQSVAINAQDPKGDIIGGTQDNGTWAFDKKTRTWFESAGGDGGVAVISPKTGIRMHTFFNPSPDVNFKGNDPMGWDVTSEPLSASREAASFYVPLIADSNAAGTFFIGLQHVWRTTDNGGPQADLDTHCNEFTGDFTITCGDWAPLGGAVHSPAGDLTGPAYGTDKGGSYIVSISRGVTKNAPLWVGTRIGRLFISANPDDASGSVVYRRIDTAAQPNRFISGIAVDPKDPLHAFVAFAGYDAYTPAARGHVFEVTYNAQTGTAQWNDLSEGLGDQPILGIAYDAASRRVFVSTDFGVLVRRHGAWRTAAPGLPAVAVYQLVLDHDSHLLYAATHGRGLYRLEVSE